MPDVSVQADLYVEDSASPGGRRRLSVSDVQPNQREFLQTTPASVWTVVHNLGRFPLGLDVIDADGNRRPLPEVTNPDTNTTVLTWLSPTAGRVVYE